MKTAASVLALAALAAAVAVMASPTYATAFGADSGERVLRLHGWYDPYLVVSLDVAPATALICALVMVVGVIWGLVRGRMRGWIVIPGIAAAAMLLLTAYDPDAAGFVVDAGTLVAPLLGAAAVLVAIAWAIARRSGGRAAA